jgi:SPOR domain
MANRDSFDEYDDDQDDGYMTFDARDEEDQSRGPLILAGIVVALGLVALIAWQLYAGAKTGDAPAQVAADTGAFKAAPAEPGGEATADLDKGVYDAGAGVNAPPLDVQPTTGAEDPLLAESGVVPPPAAPSATAPKAATPNAVPAPTVVPKPAPVAKPAPKPSETRVAEVAKPAPKPAPQPTPKPTPAPTAKPAPKVAEVKIAEVATAPKAATPSTPVATEAPAPAAPATATSTGGSRITAQLGSFQTKAAADAALARYRASGLSGPVAIVSVNLGEKGTWHRIRATGFETREEVTVFCGKAKSAGAQCIPASR